MVINKMFIFETKKMLWYHDTVSSDSYVQKEKNNGKFKIFKISIFEKYNSKFRNIL